jgi:hypothetical protein
MAFFARDLFFTSYQLLPGPVDLQFAGVVGAYDSPFFDF